MRITTASGGNMSVVDQALTLAAHGYPVFPIAASKRPTCPHGFKDACTEPADIRRLWRDHPGVLVGVPTGTVTGLFVLDLDTTRHSAAAEWFERHAPYLPETRQQTTRSGGLHLFFRHIEGLRNSAGRIALGVDTRAEGGSIIVWQPSAWLDRPRPLAEAPQWLIEMAKPKPLPPPPRLDRAAISESVARRKIEGIVGAVAAGKPGQRNAVAYWGARRLAEMVAQRILGQADAIALVVTASQQAGLPPREAAAIAASAFGRDPP